MTWYWKTCMLAVFLLVYSTILNLVSSTDYLGQCDANSAPHILIQTGGNSPRCHLCIKCPPGKGMSIKCDGRVVSSPVDVHCIDCKSGSNYSSTTDYGQCIQCPKMCENEEVKGSCSEDGDNRKCVPCKKGWYFDNVGGKCTICSCYHMNATIRQKCTVNGFPIKQCKTTTGPISTAGLTNSGSTNPTPTNPAPTNPTPINPTPTNPIPTNPAPTNPGATNPGALAEGTNASDWTILEIVLLSLVLAGILFGYFYAMWRRFCKFKENMSRQPRFKEWMKLILCWPYSVPIHASPIVVATADENDITICVDMNTAQSSNKQRRQPSFVRQYSCPATEDEKKLAKESVKTKIADCRFLRKKRDAIAEESIPLVTTPSRECKRAQLKVLDLDAEWCRKSFFHLNKGNNIGIGYTTLAGHMGYSAEKVSVFKATENPTESLVQFWSQLPTNNVLKFAELLKAMERWDIVELLEKKLPKCECCESLLEV